MRKIISIIMITLVGITIIPKTLINERHTVLESTTSVYTKEEVDNLLSTIRTNITNNTNEITNIKSELTALQNSLKDYALKTSLNETNSNIDDLNTIVTNNISRVEALENVFEQGDATAEDITKGKTAIVKGKLVTGTSSNLGSFTIYGVGGGTTNNGNFETTLTKVTNYLNGTDLNAMDYNLGTMVKTYKQYRSLEISDLKLGGEVYIYGFVKSEDNVWSSEQIAYQPYRNPTAWNDPYDISNYDAIWIISLNGYQGNTRSLEYATFIP